MVHHIIGTAIRATSIHEKNRGLFLPKNRKYLTRKLAKAAMILNIATNAAEHGEVYRRMRVAGYRWDSQLQRWIWKGTRRK